MPICISSSTQGESQWGHRPSGLWVHGSMPICIVEGNKAKASEAYIKIIHIKDYNRSMSFKHGWMPICIVEGNKAESIY